MRIEEERHAVVVAASGRLAALGAGCLILILTASCGEVPRPQEVEEWSLRVEDAVIRWSDDAGTDSVSVSIADGRLQILVSGRSNGSREEFAVVAGLDMTIATDGRRVKLAPIDGHRVLPEEGMGQTRQTIEFEPVSVTVDGTPIFVQFVGKTSDVFADGTVRFLSPKQGKPAEPRLKEPLAKTGWRMALVNKRRLGSGR